jgi:hypothetical protein
VGLDLIQRTARSRRRVYGWNPVAERRVSRLRSVMGRVRMHSFANVRDTRTFCRGPRNRDLDSGGGHREFGKKVE